MSKKSIPILLDIFRESGRLTHKGRLCGHFGTETPYGWAAAG